MIVGFIYAVIDRVHRTPILALAVTEYAAPIPPNAYAREDLDRLEQTNRANVTTQVLGERGTREAWQRFLERELRQHPGGGPDRHAVLLYLSAHGAVDEQNRPCLLLADALPQDAGTWWPVADLLALLKQAQERPEAAERKIVLLLDAGRLGEAWALGVLYNAFAELLPETVRRAEVPRLYVLNAAATAGQTAWSAPEWERHRVWLLCGPRPGR